MSSAKPVASAWALVSPSGKPVALTIRPAKREAEALAYTYLAHHKRWAAATHFWKQWDIFVAEREKRGWRVCKVQVRTA
jgi:hypothetical protein